MDEEGEGGITELQIHEADIAGLKKQLEGVSAGEKNTPAVTRVVHAMIEQESEDGFLVKAKEGAAAGEPNVFHASASAGPSDGCCIVQ